MNYLKSITTSLVSTAALCTAGYASISVSVDLESLKAANGNALPSSGVAVLVVSPDDSDFSAPISGAIIPDSSDDEILAMWDLSDPNVSSDAYSLLEQAIEYKSSEGWSSGDPLGLYWFPELDISDPTPGASETYGFYRDSSGELSGDVWELPEDGTLLHSLKLFTAGSDDLVSAGELPDLIGYALLSIGDTLGPVDAPNLTGTAEQTAGELVLSWADGSLPFGGIVIERRKVGSDEWEVVGTITDGSDSFTDDSVGRGIDYEYRLFAVNGIDSEFSGVLAADTTLRSNLVNIATRGVLGADKEVLIAGFVTQGTGDIDVMSQTVGPGLLPAGVTNYAEDPISIVYLGSEEVARDDDWSLEDAAEKTAVRTRLGATALADGSLDSAMLLPLVSDNAYTIVSSDKSGGNNVALVELYDAFDGDDVMDAETRLINISTRGKVGVDSEILIAGFVIKGEATMTVLIRGSGPGLVYNNPADFDSSEIVSDPELILYKAEFDENDQVVWPEQATNDDWASDNGEELAAAFTKTGAFAFEEDSKDAAIVADLEPGVYTVHFRGVSNATGVGLVELYEVAD